MITRKNILVLTSILLVLLTAQNISAFRYYGQAWCCDTVYYYVNPVNPTLSCGGIVVGPWFQGLVNAAANTWNSEGTAFRLQFVDTTSITCFAQSSVCKGYHDGQNTISMSGDCSWVDDNIIAYATWWYWTSGDSACCIYESDICFNDDIRWWNNAEICYGSCYDLLSVAMHEIGHWISADHENDNAVLGYKPIMYYAFNYCELRRNVTSDDSAVVNWAYDQFGNISYPYRCNTAHYHPPYPASPPHDSCWAPPECPPSCASTVLDSCLKICPASDIVWPVVIHDTCGDPICDLTGTWLDFSQCSAEPCPGEEPDWPIVYPDSCNPTTGTHYFTIDASLEYCDFCDPPLYVNGEYCRTVYARFYDTDGDQCVTSADYIHGQVCNDYNCNFATDPDDSLIFKMHLDHCCGEECDCEPGNCNGDITINILDITYLIAFLYKGGSAPTPYAICSGDPNCDCTVNILDITYLIAFLYKGGNPPCTCEQWLAACGPPLQK